MGKPACSGMVSRQRGVVVLLLVVLLGITTAAMFFTSRAATAERAIAQKHNAGVLAQARAALLGRAAADPERPGSLPCPDTNDDGTAELFAGNACPSYIGRLPWRTLQIPDLRDAAGERLWYALSQTLRDHPSAQPINSDTPGQLAVDGPEAARDVAAIVFAPGPALALPGLVQVRDGANRNDVRNYLEGENGSNPFDVNFETAAQAGTFNDQLAIITQRTLFSLVETAVARRIEREIKPLLAAHHAGWQSFPFAVSFTNPATASYVGTVPGFGSAASSGLLPVAHAWTQLSMPSPPLVTGGPLDETDCTQRNAPPAASCNCAAAASDPWCSNDTPPRAWECRFEYSGSPTLTITTLVQNAGRVFSTPVKASDITGENFTVISLTQGVGSLGSAVVSLTVKLTEGEDEATVLVPAPCPSAVSDVDNDTTEWFVANQWHRLLYYAVDDNLIPGGSGNCTAPNCFTVEGFTPADDKGALLLLVGRDLPTQRARPIVGAVALADFLEEQNETPADRIFEAGRRNASFNDRVVVLQP